MPYTMDNLPEQITKLSPIKQRAFMQAFNSAFDTCKKKNGKDCESRAFAVGNAAAKRAGEKEMVDSSHEDQKSDFGDIQIMDDLGAPKLTITQAEYSPYGASGNKGCATCRWFMPYSQSCYLVEGAIMPTGNCNYQLMMDSSLLGEDEGDLEPENELEIETEATDMEMMEKSYFMQSTGFKVLPGGLWVGWYTNAYQDKEKEWFPEAAIQKDIDRMNTSGDYPELRFWHLKGTRHGKALYAAKIGRFAVCVGQFDKNEIGEKFKSYYEKNDQQLGMSHGFSYDPDQKKAGTYYDYQTFEVSTLFLDSAANPFTAFSVERGKSMSVEINEKAKAALESILGKEATEELIRRGEKQTDALEIAKVSYKADATTANEDMQSDGEEMDIKSMMKKLVDRMDAMEKKMTSSEKPPSEKKEAKPKAEQEERYMNDRFLQLLAEKMVNEASDKKEVGERATPGEVLFNKLFEEK